MAQRPVVLRGRSSWRALSARDGPLVFLIIFRLDFHFDKSTRFGRCIYLLFTGYLEPTHSITMVVMAAVAAVLGMMQLLSVPIHVSAASECRFMINTDFSDPAGTVITNLSSPASCCDACVKLSDCVVAVWQNSTGSCYTKTSGKLPYAKDGVTSCVTGRAPPEPPSGGDPFYDCRFRLLARDYAERKVLSTWKSAQLATDALNDVSESLLVDLCSKFEAEAKTAHRRVAEARHIKPPGRDQRLKQKVYDFARSKDTVYLFVATDGDDAAAGTSTSPLATVAGAQARIRSLYPEPSARPPITVYLQGGDYYLSPRVGPLSRGNDTLPVFARFTAADSGSSADAPITYASLPTSRGGSGVPATLHGGILLTDLTWTTPPPRLGLPSATLQAKLPPGINVDPQDQLYLDGLPLVRARTPNGRPWIPLDGFNLTASTTDPACADFGTLPNIPATFDKCGPPPQPSKPDPSPCGPKECPSPPVPPIGECSPSVPGISLLYGFPKPDLVLGDPNVSTADACAALCNATSCCTGYTWHSAAEGTAYAFHCYFVANPIDVWSRAEKMDAGHVSGLCTKAPVKPWPACSGDVGPHRCVNRNITCRGDVQVGGQVGQHDDVPLTSDGAIEVDECYTHLPNRSYENYWYPWRAQAYGRKDTTNASLENMFDLTQNFPFWYGPWAGGMVVNASQPVDSKAMRTLSQLSFSNESFDGVVVHAMADGEWGGVQYEVMAADKLPSGNGKLLFRRGGWQQARSASLKGFSNEHGSRFYMEGSLEFLDSKGEWHFDSATRMLYIVPPGGDSRSASTANLIPILTQTDSLLRFEAAGGSERVQNIVIENLTLAHTSASFFLPHEETSGGDYAVARSGAFFAENASSLVLRGNRLEFLGGNGVFLSNSVRNVEVTENYFRYLGTSGVLLVGRTGDAMMDARDGEAIVASGGKDNGVRLPRNNTVSYNVFANYGIWDKQSAAFHKALAPGNEFSYNVVFNASRHGVNFQDSMGGSGVVEGNLFFNLNRETKDTAALNSWGRRIYVFSDGTSPELENGGRNDPAKPRLQPANLNSWRRNLILARPLGTSARTDYSNANCLRCDDGASWYNMSGNVCYGAASAMEFNGGTQVYTHGNLFVQGGWTVCAAPPGLGGGSFDTFVDAPAFWTSLCGMDKCDPLFQKKPQAYSIYRGDFSTIVYNSTGVAAPINTSKYFCGKSLDEWRQATSGDAHTSFVDAAQVRARYTPADVVERARAMLF